MLVMGAVGGADHGFCGGGAFKGGALLSALILLKGGAFFANGALPWICAIGSFDVSNFKVFI